MRRAMTTTGLAPENGVFRLGLILGGSWRLRRQTGDGIEGEPALGAGNWQRRENGGGLCHDHLQRHCLDLIGDNR